MNEINIPRGTSKTIPLTIKYKNKQPYVHKDSDVVRFAVKYNVEQDECDIEKTASYDAETNTYIFKFIPEDTAGLHFDRYWYDIGLQTADGDYFRVIKKSKFIVETTISKKR